jgi:hypothetical protein
MPVRPRVRTFVVPSATVASRTRLVANGIVRLSVTVLLSTTGVAVALALALGVGSVLVLGSDDGATADAVDAGSGVVAADPQAPSVSSPPSASVTTIACLMTFPFIAFIAFIGWLLSETPR